MAEVHAGVQHAGAWAQKHCPLVPAVAAVLQIAGCPHGESKAVVGQDGLAQGHLEEALREP